MMRYYSKNNEIKNNNIPIAITRYYFIFNMFILIYIFFFGTFNYVEKYGY